MDPATIALILQFALKYGPDLGLTIYSLFKQTTPITDAQWQALFTQMKQSYSQATGLPPLPSGTGVKP